MSRRRLSTSQPKQVDSNFAETEDESSPPKMPSLGLARCPLLSPSEKPGSSSSLMSCPRLRPVSTPAIGKVMICQLELGMKNMFLIGRVSHVSEIRQWNNGKGSGQAQSFSLFDGSGEIGVSLFNDHVGAFKDLLQLNTVVKVSDVYVKLGNPKFVSVPGQPFELVLNKNGKMELAMDNIPCIPFTFSTIEEISVKPAGSFVDFKGILYEDQGLTEGTSFVLRQLMIVDETGFCLLVKLWGEAAKSFVIECPQAIWIRRAKVDDYQNKKSLNVGYNGDLMTNYDPKEGKRLQDWFNDAVAKAKLND